MSIDKFGLGDWWPRPEQAAAGGLDHLPADQWPMLAARWLAAGFDSPLLRQLAGLRSGQQVVGRSGEHGVVAWPASGGQSNPSAPWTSDGRAAARAALELMPEAMRSIGFDPAPADEEFVARCQSALDVVRHDLDVTGCGRYRMRASFSAGWPRTVYATLPDGSYWGEGEGMSRGMGSSWLLFSAADSVSATIKEATRSSGRCAPSTAVIRRLLSGTVRSRPTSSTRWCGGGAPTQATREPVGQLTAEIAKTL
jgi:hypothetical protein